MKLILCHFTNSVSTRKFCDFQFSTIVENHHNYMTNHWLIIEVNCAVRGNVSLLFTVTVGSVGNRLDFHNQASIWPNRSMVDCCRFMGQLLKISAHGRWDEGMISAITPLGI